MEGLEERVIKGSRTVRRSCCAAFLRFVAIGLLAGCALASPSYEGTAARPDNQRPLETAGDTPAVWRSRDVAIHYTARREGDVFLIEGRIERLGPVVPFARIDSLRVEIHFIDAGGMILASRLLWTAGVGTDPRFVRWTFDQRYTLPPNAAAIGFSYRGGFSESGDEGEGQVDWKVWRRP